MGHGSLCRNWPWMWILGQTISTAVEASPAHVSPRHGQTWTRRVCRRRIDIFSWVASSPFGQMPGATSMVVLVRALAMGEVLSCSRPPVMLSLLSAQELSFGLLGISQQDHTGTLTATWRKVRLLQLQFTSRTLWLLGVVVWCVPRVAIAPSHPSVACLCCRRQLLRPQCQRANANGNLTRR